MMHRGSMQRYAALIVAVALAGCGGSHASSAFAPPTGGGPASAAKTRGVNLTLTIPDRTTSASHRVPAYVSAATQSAIVSVSPGPIVTDVALTGAACTPISGGRVCSFSVTAPITTPGFPDTFSLALYDTPCGGGPPCTITGGNALSAASGFTAYVTEGAANVTVPLTLGGVVAGVQSFAVAQETSSVPPASSHDLAIAVTGVDAAGDIIVGPASYVDASGNAVSLNVSAREQFANSSNLPQFVLDGVLQAGVASVSIPGPGHTLALRVDTPGQAVLGVQLRVTSTSSAWSPAKDAFAYYAAPGNVPSYLPASTPFAVFLNNGTITATGMPAYVTSATPSNFGLSLGSSNGWITNTTGTSNWTSIGSNSYCSVPNASVIKGIANAPDGTFYASYIASGLPTIARIPLGSANAPCTFSGGPVSFPIVTNTGGKIVVGSQTIFAVNHTTTTLPLATEEVMILSTDLSQHASYTFPPGSTSSNGLAGAIIDPVAGESSFFVVARFTDTVFHLTGTPGSPTSYIVAGQRTLPNCHPNDIVADRTLLYISCANFAKIMTIDPTNFSATPVTLTANTGTGSIAAPDDLALGPDGYLWLLTPGNTVQKYSRTGTLQGSIAGTSLTAVQTGNDGELWFAESDANACFERLAQGTGP